MNTEHQKNQENIWLTSVKVSDEGFSTIVKSSPLGIIVVDLDGIIRFWNKAAEEIFGWREDEVLGRSTEVFSQDQNEAYEDIRRRTLQKEIFTSVPVSAVKKDRSIIQISYSAAAVHDEKKRVVGTVIILFDITVKMELESALKASLEKMSRVRELMLLCKRSIRRGGVFMIPRRLMPVWRYSGKGLCCLMMKEKAMVHLRQKQVCRPKGLKIPA
jgi:PAS domain S-box-containing protein